MSPIWHAEAGPVQGPVSASKMRVNTYLWFVFLPILHVNLNGVACPYGLIDVMVMILDPILLY